MAADDYHYIAFISYRHEAVGRKWAAWLHRTIENYRVPASLVKAGKAPRRLGRVFRDEEELAASSDLSRQIDAALVESKFLIVVCTPRTPHSRWVDQEIQRFRALGRGDRILALLVEGEPRESFPPSLVEIRRTAVESQAAKDTAVDEIEPLAADVREDMRTISGHSGGHTRSMAKLRLLATLLGVRFDDLRNRELRRAHGRVVTAGVAALVVAAVFGGLGLYAMNQKSLADVRLVQIAQERDEKERQRAEAERQRAEAQTQAAIAQQTNEFLANMLASADPERLLGDKVTVVQAINAAVRELDAGALQAQPQVEAAVRYTIGRTLQGLGRLDLAEPHLVRALQVNRQILSPDHPDLAFSVNDLALLLQAQGKLPEAEALLREALEITRKSLPKDDPQLAASLLNLGHILQLQQKLVDAEPLYREALEIWRQVLPPSHPNLAMGINNLAGLMQGQGKLQEAESLFRESLQRRRQTLPPGHLDIAMSMNNLAMVLRAQGKPAEAEPLLREALDMRRAALPEGHPGIALGLNNLAGILQLQGKLSEAEPLFREALQIRQQSLPPGHVDIIFSSNNLAKLLIARGNHLEAEPLVRDALRMAISNANIGRQHATTRSLGSSYASVLFSVGCSEEAQRVATVFGGTAPATAPSTDAATRPSPAGEQAAEIGSFVAWLETEVAASSTRPSDSGGR
jgi:tetratricopeptide (TPR) repeat protein